jgi:HEAT repeat protein
MSDSRSVGFPVGLPNTYNTLGFSGMGSDAIVGPNPSSNTVLGYAYPLQIGGSFTNTPGTVVVIDDSAFVSINLGSSTTSTAVTKVVNAAAASSSFTVVTTLDQCTRIFSAQCDRVSSYIFGQLERATPSDQDQNEVVANSIAGVIDLVGEPAAYTAVFEADLLRNEPTVLEPLLLGIGSASHKETEGSRAAVLRQFADSSNYRVRRAAVRALGRMNTTPAKDALREISKNGQGEISQLAAAFLR